MKFGVGVNSSLLSLPLGGLGSSVRFLLKFSQSSQRPKQTDVTFLAPGAAAQRRGQERTEGSERKTGNLHSTRHTSIAQVALSQPAVEALQVSLPLFYLWERQQWCCSVADAFLIWVIIDTL